MRRLNQREKAIFSICLVLALVYAGYNLVFKPLEARKEQVSDAITVQTKRLHKNIKSLQESADSDDKYGKLVEQYKQKVGNEQVMSEMITDIQAESKQMSLNIADLKPQKERIDGQFTQFSVSLTLDSSFADMVKFLEVLQDEKNNFEVDEISFEKGNSRTNSLLRVRLVLSRIFITQE
ncbi:MAG: type 4a pilus biogenesis protein PilO [Candidatus Omnitrophica bacterium]|nr:type 4a pilus biogenesis protein PilO [Candidatus Omnitrophota bacterium]